MKNLFVPIGGGMSDAAVLATAWSVARATGAHLTFFHVTINPGDAALWLPHADFARGAAVHAMIDELQREAEQRASGARQHVEEFCRRNDIEFRNTPHDGVFSASWRESTGDAERQLVTEARFCDLVVIARQTQPNGLSPYLIERLLLDSGRPLLIVPRQARPDLMAAVMVCWKDTPEAARAVTAAMPLLVKAKRVIVAAVGQVDPTGPDKLAATLGWHGIAADTERISASRPTGVALLETAQAQNVDLLVLGGYGHSRTREVIFGGVTQTILDAAAMPVLIAH
jgi:nucleotide-binding universal stress UspA family protein